MPRTLSAMGFEFATRVYNRRKELGLTQAALYRKMYPNKKFYDGCFANITMIENGKREFPRLDTAADIARGLEVSIDWLYYGDKKPC